MSFYENTLVTKQDLPKSELSKIKDKYSEIINSNSGKVIKIEEWGLLNLARKIKRYNKGFYIHYKFEGTKKTLDEVKNKISQTDYDKNPNASSQKEREDPNERRDPKSQAPMLECINLSYHKLRD